MRLVLRMLCVGLVVSAASCHDASSAQPAADLDTATFALGCYWCAQHAFDGLEGVAQVTAGHAGLGSERREAVVVDFDPRIVSYEQLLDEFWLNVDPLDPEGQFCDRGRVYGSAIFVHGKEQRRLATASKQRLEAESDWKIATEILDAGSFEPVRESEQFYYRRNPVRYRFYRLNCGRDARLHELWGERAGGKTTEH